MIREAELLTEPGPWLRVEVIRDRARFARMKDEWHALHEESEASLFNAWEWLHPWSMHLGEGRRLHILAARERGGRLVGLLPLSVERRRVAGRLVRRLAFLGDSHVGSDYLDLVARREDREAVAQLFADHLIASWREWDLLELLDVDAGSPTLSTFRRRLARDPFEMSFDERFVCPFERFGPQETFDAFLLRTGRRQNYLRRRKWLEAQPGFAIERTTAPEESGPALEEFFRLHALRWDRAGGSMGITGPEVAAFHRDAARLFAGRGQLRLYTMWLGGAAVASVYGFVHGERFLYYQAGYDPRFSGRSVGLVLVGETFRDALASGLREFDFLRGLEPYKSEWTTRERFTVGMRVWRRRGAGAWLVGAERLDRAARGFVRRTLPSPLLEGLRRVRRRLPHT